MKKDFIDPEMQKEYENHVENIKHNLGDIAVESAPLLIAGSFSTLLAFGTIGTNVEVVGECIELVKGGVDFFRSNLPAICILTLALDVKVFEFLMNLYYDFEYDSIQQISRDIKYISDEKKEIKELKKENEEKVKTLKKVR